MKTLIAALLTITPSLSFATGSFSNTPSTYQNDEKCDQTVIEIGELEKSVIKLSERQKQEFRELLKSDKNGVLGNVLKYCDPQDLLSLSMTNKKLREDLQYHPLIVDERCNKLTKRYNELLEEIDWEKKSLGTLLYYGCIICPSASTIVGMICMGGVWYSVGIIPISLLLMYKKYWEALGLFLLSGPVGATIGGCVSCATACICCNCCMNPIDPIELGELKRQQKQLQQVLEGYKLPLIGNY